MFLCVVLECMDDIVCTKLLICGNVAILLKRSPAGKHEQTDYHTRKVTETYLGRKPRRTSKWLHKRSFVVNIYYSLETNFPGSTIGYLLTMTYHIYHGCACAQFSCVMREYYQTFQCLYFWFYLQIRWLTNSANLLAWLQHHQFCYCTVAMFSGLNNFVTEGIM